MQKVSTVTGAVSFILAIVCCVLLYLRIEKVGGYNPIAASLEASIFFFISVGVVLTIIGRSNLPNLKIDLK